MYRIRKLLVVIECATAGQVKYLSYSTYGIREVQINIINGWRQKNTRIGIWVTWSYKSSWATKPSATGDGLPRKTTLLLVHEVVKDFRQICAFKYRIFLGIHIGCIQNARVEVATDRTV